ncbi:hypothetical protein [Methanobacterium sp. MZD130B]|uniref:hypothetical protein n=1 Tax=Methanobacterium sp. MZD130B TaxID=3394378 RepID=UPI0039FC9910
MEIRKKLSIIIISVIIIIAAFYTNSLHNSLKTQEFIISTKNQVKIADDYYNKADEYVNNGDYENAIIMREKSAYEISKALKDVQTQSLYSTGVYKVYFNNKICLLSSKLRLINLKLQLDHQNNPKEKTYWTDYNLSGNNIKMLNQEIIKYESIEKKIIAKNKDSFKLLKL